LPKFAQVEVIKKFPNGSSVNTTYL